MALFGECLKRLVDKSSCSVYSLAQKAGVERTMIYKAIAEERVPSREFLEKICRAVRATPREEMELMETYNIFKIGPDIYAQRGYITRMIERLSLAPRPEEQLMTNGQMKREGNPRYRPTAVQVFTGTHAVYQLIREFIDMVFLGDWGYSLRIFVPVRFSYFYDQLYQNYITSTKDITITQVIRFAQQNQRELHNLKQLEQVMPFAFAPKHSYYPYYYYYNNDVSENIPLTLPYYLIADKLVIAFSTDFKQAALFHHPDMVKLYNEVYDQVLEHTRPLMAQMMKGAEMMGQCLAEEEKIDVMGNTIDIMPCLLDFITPEYIERKVRREFLQRKEYVEYAKQHFGMLAKKYRGSVSMFTEEGLAKIAEEGKMLRLSPEEMVLPATRKERLQYLSRLRNAIETDQICARLVNPAKMTLTKHISITNLCGRGVRFVGSDEQQKEFRMLYITEPSISEAFEDYKLHMEESALTVGKKETLRMIDEYITKCQKL